MSERVGSDMKRLLNWMMNFSKLIEYNVIQFESGSMSDPPLFDIDFKNKMYLVWTTLKFFKNFRKTLIKTIYFSSKSSTNCQITRIKSALQIMLWIWGRIDYSQFYHLIITGWFYRVKWASNSQITSMRPISVSPDLIVGKIPRNFKKSVFDPNSPFLGKIANDS